MTGRAEVRRLTQQLDAAFDRAKDLTDKDLEVQADMAKYLCILVSGYVERCTAEFCLENMPEGREGLVSNAL